MDPPTDVKGVIQIIISAHKESKLRVKSYENTRFLRHTWYFICVILTRTIYKQETDTW